MAFYAAGAPGQAAISDELKSLIEAERAFSRTSEAKGIREAFLTWLAPDSIVFRPAPTPGRPVYEKMDPANPAVLTWEPEFAEIAASGELGYTTGPYRIRPRRDADPTGFGHYVSIWKKQADGAWKVFLDIGVQHDDPGALPSSGLAVTGATASKREPLSPEALRLEEYAFGKRASAFDSEVGSKGMRQALADAVAGDVRVYRPGRMPAIGKRSLKPIVPAEAERIRENERRDGALRTGLAWSGDLAFSYGTAKTWKGPSIAAVTAYLRIWRRGPSGAWKICLDIELPLPESAWKDEVSPS
jgi:ketosteroid isomerase-like protein